MRREGGYVRQRTMAATHQGWNGRIVNRQSRRRFRSDGRQKATNDLANCGRVGNGNKLGGRSTQVRQSSLPGERLLA